MDKLSSLKNRIILLAFIAAFFLFLSQLMIFFYNHINQRDLAKTLGGVENEQIQLLLELDNLKNNEINFITTKEDGYKVASTAIIRDKIKPYVSVLNTSLKNLQEDEEKALIDTLKNNLLKLASAHIEIVNRVSKQTDASLQDRLSTVSDSNMVLSSHDYVAENRSYVNNTLEPLYSDASLAMAGYFDRRGKILKAEVERVNLSLGTHSYYSLVVMFIGMGICLLITLLMLKDFNKSMNFASLQLSELAKGDIPDKIPVDASEVGQLINWANTISDNLNKASKFAIAIGEGQYEEDFIPSSEKDTLSNSLLQMRQKLMKVTEDDKIRNWSIEGIAKIVEIIRSHNLDFKLQMDNILKYMVKYVGAHQGGLFVLNNEDQHNHFLELKACYAFDRKKFIEKRINIGDGLVGQVYLEKESIYMVDIPNEYITIKSGLGDAFPGSVLIVPLKINEEVEGIIELASFKHFQKHEVEFVEKIGETLASTISSIKISERTTYLLTTSQEKTEQMQAQEEEMRQNLEELQATQEQMQRKESEMQELLNASIKEKEELLARSLKLESEQSKEKKLGGDKAEAHANEIVRLKGEFANRENNYVAEINILKSTIEDMKQSS